MNARAASSRIFGAWLFAGSYNVEGYSFECTGVFTNTVPTDAYRGAGRPEATYAIERAVDALARKLGKDPVEVRRLNFIREFPAAIASGLTIDSRMKASSGFPGPFANAGSLSRSGPTFAVAPAALSV